MFRVASTYQPRALDPQPHRHSLATVKRQQHRTTCYERYPSIHSLRQPSPCHIPLSKDLSVRPIVPSALGGTPGFPALPAFGPPSRRPNRNPCAIRSVLDPFEIPHFQVGW